MTPPTTDQYQRTIDLLDDDRLWDRYLTQLQDKKTQGRDQADEQRPSADPRVLPEQSDGERNVTVLPLADQPSKSTTRRPTRFQRAAVAAAAGIAIVAGVTLLNTDREREPIDLSTETIPTPTAEAPGVVVVASPEPEPTAVPPTPTSPEPTPTSEPLATPNPEPTPQPPPEPEPEPPPSSELEDETSSSLDTATAEESTSPDDTPAGATPAYPVDSSSGLGQVLTEINELRSSQGLPDLLYSPALSAVAHEHAWSLTDYQDTDLSRQPNFNLDPIFVGETDPLRESAWTLASVVGGIDIGGQLPAGWSNWQHYIGREPVLDVARTDGARELHGGEFTHVGVASANGKFASATVLVYAKYPGAGPAEPSVVVRTDVQCFERVADPDRGSKVIINTNITIGTPSWPDTMSHVEVRVCAGIARNTLPQFDLDSRYSVSVVRRPDGNVMGTFTCFVWNTCEAVVDLDGSRAGFDIVLNKLSPDFFEFSHGQIQAVFRSTDGQVATFVAGNGSRLIDSDAMQAFSDRIGQSGGGWILESD